MISGRVSEELDPLVSVEIGNGQSNFQPVEVIVDTGFTGELALSSQLIQSLGLHYIDDARVVLADRQERRLGAYDGVVSWHGEPFSVIVLETDGDSLLGMSLLLDSRLTVSCRPNGPVVIEEEEP